MNKKILILFVISLVILFLFSAIICVFIYPKKYKNHVVAFSDKYDLDKALVYAIIKAESNFKKDAVSKSGALGLMQILPKTASWIADELNENFSKDLMFESGKNIEFGCFYLRYLFDKFKEIDVVICAYNAGEGKVLDWINDGVLDRNKIDYLETKNYLVKVENYYRVYRNNLIDF